VRCTLHLPSHDSPTEAASFETLDEALAAIAKFESRERGDSRLADIRNDDLAPVLSQ
jgi:hypothetical protein